MYRYAPWFAWLTVPVTFLPVQVAGTLWSAVLLVASGVAVLPAIRARAWLLVAFFLPILVGISAVGNVHALMIAWLVHGVGRRSGPLWIALAASLKIFPILLAAVYAGRRRVVAARPDPGPDRTPLGSGLAFGLQHYPVEAGQAASLIAIPALWVVIVGAAAVAALWLARGPFGWLAAATSVVLAVPRLFVYDVTYLLVGTAPVDPVAVDPTPPGP